MENLKIITLHPIFNEPAIVFATRLGCVVETDFNPQAGELYIVFGAHDKAPELLDIQKRLNYKFFYVIMNSESPESVHLTNKFYLELLKTNFVFDYSNISAIHLQKNLGINIKSFFFFDFPTYTQDEAPEREIDILFVGTKSNKREFVYNSLREAYPDKNIEFVFDNSLIAPVKLTEKLYKSKYVLNIPYYEHNILETHRIHKALSCGCRVVSTFSGDWTTDEFYKDYIHLTDDVVSAFKDTLPEPAKKYTEAQTFLTQKLTTHNKWMLEKIMKKLSANI
jgi:hypothetical protein